MDRLPGLRFHTFGVTPLALLVNSANPVNNITLQQARQIYQGDIQNWSKLGGNNRPIKTIGSLHCAKRPGHWRHLLANEDLFGPQFTAMGDMADNIAMVAKDPNIISYESLSVASHFQDRVKWKALKINGNHPSDLEHLRAGNYPIYRVFNATTWDQKNLKNPHAQKLMQYLIQQIANIEEKAGIIPAAKLKKSGWKFKGSELIGEPL